MSHEEMQVERAVAASGSHFFSPFSSTHSIRTTSSFWPGLSAAGRPGPQPLLEAPSSPSFRDSLPVSPLPCSHSSAFLVQPSLSPKATLALAAS